MYLGAGFDCVQSFGLSLAAGTFIIPIMNLAVFTFLAQYVVPELARGLRDHSPNAIPYAVVAGMVITIAWGDSLGTVAFYLANIFALCAMLTSFLAIGFTTMRNVLNIFHWKETGWQRITALLFTVIPPLMVFFAGFTGFVAALTYAGGFAGAIMSIIPVLLLRAARKNGNCNPEWQVTWQAYPLIQLAIVVVYCAAFAYSLWSLVGI
ncbi:Hypothetical protein CulFRC11_2172 [Corynebacterium ramonii]|uniref:Tryptophan/tyrosine permease family protein n=1 Tax=Corynebacterium ramonii TaxID=3026968 RepID=A0ABN4F3L9_9CORY|nr:Hypothetical protein CulFRC11_2172 [Corynebacterium ramonii FRC0011]